MTQDEQTRWGRWLDSAGVPRVTVNNIPMSFGSRLAWLCEHNAQQLLAPDSLKAGDFSLPESVKVENVLPAESG